MTASIQSDTSSTLFTQSAQSTVTPASSIDSASILPPPSRHRPSRSFSLLHNFIPKDKFSSLIRTHSASNPRRPSATITPGQKEIISNRTINALVDYANQQQTYSSEQCIMLIPNMNEVVGTRKSENKLYNFFRARSRSRSKSKQSRSQSADVPPPDESCPPLPTTTTTTTSSHTRYASLEENMHDLENQFPPSIITSPIPRPTPLTASGSKPLTRSQSRPLSATTTGTHSTITSLVTPTQIRLTRPKQKKFGSGSSGHSNGNGRGSVKPASSTSSLDEGHDYEPERRPSTGTTPSTSSPPSSQPPSASTSLSAAATPKPPSSTRMKLHNIFGIPFSSHRSSFGARSSNSTPIPHVLDLPPSPPLPVQYTSKYADLSSTPRNRPSSSYRRATSPSPQGRSDETSTGVTTTSASASGKTKKEKRRSATALVTWLPPRLFSGSTQAVDRDSATITSSPLVISKPRLTILNPDSTSTLHTQTTHTHASSNSDYRDRGMSSSIHAPRPSEDVPPVPKITHTPPTPQRGGGPTASSSSLTSQTHRRGVSSPRSSGYSYEHARNRSLVVVGEASLTGLRDEAREEKEPEPRRGRWSPMFFGSGDASRGKGKEKETTSEWDRLMMEKEKEQTHAKLSTRVGSPIDGRANGSFLGNGSVLGAARNTRGSKHGSFDFEIPRPLSGGSGASRGTIAAPSIGESKEKSKDGKLGRNVSFSNPHSKRYRHNQPSTSTSPRTHRRGLLDTAGPTTTIATSLFPNHTGRAVAEGVTSAHTRKTKQTGPITSTSSWGRATTATATTATGGHSGSGSVNAKRRGTGLSHGSFPFEPAVAPCSTSAPAASELGLLASGDSGYEENASANGSTTTTLTNSGRRGKGRSLDLNIRLAWAPTKVKEEAVMQSFGAKGRERRERDKEEEKKRFESEVSELFRDVLGENGFVKFKKYLRRFHAKTISFDGPSGLIARVEKLLNAAPPPGLEAHERQELLERFIQVVLQDA